MSQGREKHYDDEDVVTSSGKYHRPFCHVLLKVSKYNRKRLRSWKDALALGLQPCGLCSPYSPPDDTPSVGSVVHIVSVDHGRTNIFLSHASEDKDTIARPLYDALRRAGLTVWFDEAELKIGDRLHRKIDDGLARSDHGVVIISPSFLRKNWPQNELDGLFACEEADGRPRILPIWHDIGHADLARRSPMLADRIAGKSSEGIPVLVREILKVVRPVPDSAAIAEDSTVPFTGKKLPILQRGDVSRVGIGSPLTGTFGIEVPEGIAFFISNIERRFPTTALDLMADLTLQYIDGEEVHIEKAPWFKNTTASRGVFLFERVDIGMLEMAAVVYAVRQQNAFYAAIYDGANGISLGREIAYGDWTMLLDVRGKNFHTSFRGALSFLPNGSSSFSPIGPTLRNGGSGRIS